MRAKNCPTTAQQLAEACAATLWPPDTCSQWLGMQLEEVRPGYARISMKVRPEFLNGDGICPPQPAHTNGLQPQPRQKTVRPLRLLCPCAYFLDA